MQTQLKSVQVLTGPYSAPYNYRANDIYKVRDAGTGKIADGTATPDAGALGELNKQVQAILDQPRPSKIR